MFGDGEEDSWQRNIEYQDYEAGRSWASGRKELRTSVSGRQHGGGGRPDAQALQATMRNGFYSDCSERLGKGVGRTVT